MHSEDRAISRKSMDDTEHWLAGVLPESFDSDAGWDATPAPAPPLPQPTKRGGSLRKLMRSLSFKKKTPQTSQQGTISAVQIILADVPAPAAAPPPPPPPPSVSVEGSRRSYASSIDSAASSSSKRGASTPGKRVSFFIDRGSTRRPSVPKWLSAGWGRASKADEPLEDGWREVVAEDGRVYFWHEATDATSWTRPEAPAPAPAPAPATSSLEERANAYRELQRTRMAAFKPLGRNRNSVSHVE